MSFSQALANYEVRQEAQRCADEDSKEKKARKIEARAEEIAAQCWMRASLQTDDGYSLAEAITEEIDDLDFYLALLFGARDDIVILARFEEAKEHVRNAVRAYAQRNAEFEAFKKEQAA